MLYRTDDFTRWGPGVDIDFTAPQIDGNFWELRDALNKLIASPPSPVSIASVTAIGSALTFNMSDGSTIGPITLPVASFKWRGDWLPTTSYAALDVFRVAGVGLYLVNVGHTSPAVFDPAFIEPISGLAAYISLFTFDVPVNLIYDIGFSYPGLLSAVTSDVTYLYQEPVVRAILVPMVPFAGSAHQAYLQTAPSTHAQTFNVYDNDGQIGTVTFAIAAKSGVITLSSDTNFAVGDRLAVGPALVADATAAGLSIVFAAQQVAM